jgi:hypothetical protein
LHDPSTSRSGSRQSHRSSRSHDASVRTVACSARARAT